jgi:hypothetical protein
MQSQIGPVAVPLLPRTDGSLYDIRLETLATLRVKQRNGLAHRGALRHVQVDWCADDVGACSASDHGRHRDGTGLGSKLPEQLVDLREITLGKGQRLAIIKDEANRAARHAREYRKPLFESQFKRRPPKREDE